LAVDQGCRPVSTIPFFKNGRPFNKSGTGFTPLLLEISDILVPGILLFLVSTNGFDGTEGAGNLSHSPLSSVLWQDSLYLYCTVAVFLL
jgi:hypothetical protein